MPSRSALHHSVLHAAQAQGLVKSLALVKLPGMLVVFAAPPLLMLALASGCQSTSAPAPATAGLFGGQGGLNVSDAHGDANGQPGSSTAVSCTANETKCSDLQHKSTCAPTGDAWTDVPCGAGEACEDNQCRPSICQAGASTCQGTAVAQCSARGTALLKVTPCPAGESCLAGQCKAMTCSPGAVVCQGNAVATCHISGQKWTIKSCASDQGCASSGDGLEGAACQAQICVAGKTTCKGSRVYLCDAQGLSESVAEDCAATSSACVAGTCVAKVCKPASIDCAGGEATTCNPAGTGWTSAKCAEGLVCAAGTCVPQVCVPSEVFCDGAQVAECSASGATAQVIKTCGSGSACKLGSCTASAILCGDGLCDTGESAASCAKDCQATPMVAADFDQIPANAPLGKTRVPRLLLKDSQPTWSTGHLLQVRGGSLVALDVDNSALVRMNRLTLKVEATLALGSRPGQLVLGPDGTAWVSLRDTGMLAKIPHGFVNSTAIKPFFVGAEPRGLAMNAAGTELWVALTGEDAILKLDADNGSVLGRATTLGRPKGVLATATGDVIVLHGDGMTLKLTPTEFSKDPKAEAVVKGSQVVLRKSNPVPVCQGQITVKERVANRAIAATIDPETGAVLVAHVLVNSGSAQEVLSGVGIKPPEKPQQFVQKCSGGYGSTCSMVPVPPPPGEPVCVGQPVRPYELTLSKLALTGATITVQGTIADKPIVDMSSGRSFLARFDQPMEVVHHPTLSMAMVVAQGTNNVLVVNTAAVDPMQWPLADIKVGAGPVSIGFTLDGSKAYVLNAVDFTVSEVDLTPLVALASSTQVTGPLAELDPLYLKHSKAAPYGTDPLDAAGQLGRRVFYSALNSRISVANRFVCATCHLEGTEDKNVWFVGEGPRQTPALAGRLADTAPYNWLGGKFTLHDNMVATTARMGGAGLLESELAALEVFLLKGLQAPPNPNLKPEGLTPQQAAGKALFHDDSVGCSKCHVPGNGTDGAQHDVGTATSVELQVASATGKTTKLVYNTPSLRGLFYTAPYLHDGSAPTLHAALKKTASTMGKTAQLTPQQLDDLVAYLLTL